MAGHVFSLEKLPTYLFWHCFGWSMVIHTITGTVMVPAVKKHGIMRLTTRRSNGQSASFSTRQNIITRKAGFISPSAQNFAVVPLVAWYRKREIRSSSSYLTSWTVFWMTVSTSSLNARKLCVKFFSVNIMIDTTKSTRHVIDQTTSCHKCPDTANEAHGGSALHQGVVPYCGIYRVEPT